MKTARNEQFSTCHIRTSITEQVNSSSFQIRSITHPLHRWISYKYFSQSRPGIQIFKVMSVMMYLTIVSLLELNLDPPLRIENIPGGHIIDANLLLRKLNGQSFS
jgi:hypothetical protein